MLQEPVVKTFALGDHGLVSVYFTETEPGRIDVSILAEGGLVFGGWFDPRQEFSARKWSWKTELLSGSPVAKPKPVMEPL